MVELLKAAPNVITAAKENPLALVALLLLLVAWVVVTLKVRRNRQLLKSLKQLPAKDRLKALQAEMGHIEIKGGMSAEQWLRHSAQQYYFAAFGLTCLLVVILVAILWYTRQQMLQTGVSLSLHEEESSGQTAATASPSEVIKASFVPEIRAATKWGARQMAEDGIPPERTVSYESRVENGIAHIRYYLPYLDLVRHGGPITGSNPLNATFKWRFPELSIKVVNNTKETMVLAQAFVTILSSEVEEYPLLVVDDFSVSDLIIRNEGWGEISNAVLELAIDEPHATDEVPLFSAKTNTVPIATFSAVQRVPIARFVPERLRDEPFVTVSGRIIYEHAKRKESLSFNTHVALQVKTAAGIPVTHSYNAYFRANEAPTTVALDMALQVAPGAGDRFLILLGTDKTSHSHIKVDFKTAGGEKLSAGDFWIDLFAPRSASASRSALSHK